MKERLKLYREFLKTSQFFQAGQFNAMKAFLAQHFGVRLTEESSMLAPEEEKETQQINDKSKDSSKTPEMSDEETNSKENA